MPANTEILPKFKSYVGRTFLLRKNKTIPASIDKQAKERKEYDRNVTFGEGCLVLDETNSRVKVTTLDGSCLWTAKFYLHKELIGNQFKDHDYIVNLSEKLLNLKHVFEDIYNNDNSKHLIDAVLALRQYADELKKQC